MPGACPWIAPQLMWDETQLTLLGMVMGRHASLRMMVRMGSTRSTTPTNHLLPLPGAITSILSPTTKGREMNCTQGQPALSGGGPEPSHIGKNLEPTATFHCSRQQSAAAQPEEAPRRLPLTMIGTISAPL